jgi:hypothetical protein
MDALRFVPDVTPMTAEDWEGLAWKGALKHTGPLAGTELQGALMRKTNCALYLIYIGCVSLCIKRTGPVLDQKLSRYLLGMAYAYQFDWRYPKLFGITIDDVENKEDKVTAVRRSIAYFFFEIVGQASSFFTPQQVVHDVSYMIQLTRHLCGKANRKVVNAWLEGLIERLNQVAPLTIQHKPSIYDYPDRAAWEAATRQTHGKPLPLELLDLGLDLAGADLDVMATAWLRGLDPLANPLLQPADVLVAKGFQGIPYRP